MPSFGIPPAGGHRVYPLYYDIANEEFVVGSVVNSGGSDGNATLSSIIQPNSDGNTSYTQPTVGTTADNVSASTQRGLDTRAFLYGFDGSNFDRLRVSTIAADGIATTNVTLQVASFLYAFNGTTWDRLRIDGADALSTRERTPNTLTTAADEALSTASEQIFAANTARKHAIIQNLEAAGGNNVRVGDSNVTTTRGIRLAPGESVTLETTAAIHAIAEAGTPSVSRVEVEYS